ncbi:MAG: preprotein translocase subunit SecY [Bacillota bacterium]
MLGILFSAWKVPELRKKIVFTMLMFLVYRLGAHIPIPGINTLELEKLMQSGTILGFFDLLSGGAFSSFTVFAMGIMPYITASIIMQLLTIVIPYLEKLSKEGDEGRKKIVQITRYGTVVLAFIQAFMTSVLFSGQGILANPGVGTYVTIAITLTAGTAFLMWLGELITEKGIGNGISLIIFTSIVSSLPSQGYQIIQFVRTGQTSIIAALFFIVVAVAVIAGIVFIQEGQRRIPVQYAKRVVGRRVYGGQTTHIPLKVNQAGVIPVIFAVSLLLFPPTISSWFPGNAIARQITNFFDPRSVTYMLVYGLLIVFFTYFYTAVTFNPQDVADNMKKYGGFIPGLRPGKPTAEYIDKVLSRITLAGAVFLAFVALMPNLVMSATGLQVYFGGTSLLIVVGVALETMKQLESQLLMRHYQGFIK